MNYIFPIHLSPLYILTICPCPDGNDPPIKIDNLSPYLTCSLMLIVSRFDPCTQYSLACSNLEKIIPPPPPPPHKWLDPPPPPPSAVGTAPSPR